MTIVQTILNLCMVLGFLVRRSQHDVYHFYQLPSSPFFFPSQAHGYATNEFEVTVERLGVYLPV